MTGLIFLAISSTHNYDLYFLLSFNIPGWLLSPLWIGPLLFCLSWLESGQAFRYQTVIINGLRPWWKLLTVPVIIVGVKYLAVLGTQLAPPGYRSFVWWLLLLIAIVIAIRYIFIFPVFTLEKYGLIQAWRRCASLSKGRRLNLFFELIALWLLLYVAVFFMTMLLGMAANLGSGFASTFISLIVIMGIIYPMVYALIIVWIYYGYKVRAIDQDCDLAG
ncbi:MAG TPA: glycerophosphoryl diester phosphodiesterase membrane domain-containing protein [Syntrophomonadaceae bacterium]|nr:glycerophosphoryl diester phosphodiesterase membrane domain-containing protein [Syntrophomonadaceae bacterium]